MTLDGPNGPDRPAIRPYHPEDLAAVYDICVRTGDAGGDARGKYYSDDLIPDVFAGPYVYLEPGFAFVLDHQHQPVGYVIGTPDTAAFARGYRERWIPRLADRYPVPPDPPLTPDEEMLALHYRPERLLWPGLPAYPAHLHIGSFLETRDIIELRSQLIGGPKKILLAADDEYPGNKNG